MNSASAAADSRPSLRVAVVCLGNICRSPMANVVLNQRLNDAGLQERIEVTSAGTGDWHVGSPMDERAALTLAAHGYDGSHHRARQATVDLLDRDLILAMDASNMRDLNSLLPSRAPVHLFREWDPQAGPGAEVPDPYYGGNGGFEEVLAMIERTSDALVAHLVARLRRPSR